MGVVSDLRVVGSVRLAAFERRGWSHERLSSPVIIH